MQQRVNNLWLSDQLIESALQQREAAKEHAAPDPAPGTNTRKLNRKRPELSLSRRRRRRWQQAATALLLVGSAAFSYLSWSQPELRKNTHRQVPQDANADNQAQVYALRVQNRELQIRIQNLEQALHTPAPKAP